MLNLINRMMAGGPVVADVAQPTVSGRTLVRYALGLGLRLWGDGILNRAAELERERLFDQRDAAAAELAALNDELAEKRQTARLLDAENERRLARPRSLYEMDCERAGVPLIPEPARDEQAHGCELADKCVHDSRCENWPNCSTREAAEDQP